jgi:hypothetical protein
VTTPLASTRTRLAALALAVALVPLAAGTADAAYKPHHRHGVVTKRKKAVTAKRAAAKPAATPAPAAVPAPAPAAAPTSVISIGGYIFYNLTYEQAVAAYQAAVAAGGPPPPPVTSVSVTTTVGGTA